MPEGSFASHPLFDFKDSDVKFKLERLMNILRDNRHESWVLSAYPDPKTSRPLIGAGFSLDVAATPHPQHDPINPNSFVELSSAQLWQAAGLDQDLLQDILEQFDRDLNAWKEQSFRKKIMARRLSPELTEEEATKLLRISAIEAIHNAKAYCGRFDQLTGSQQMALAQLVFQMGINLEEFVHFLTAINEAPATWNSMHAGMVSSEEAYWRTVQRTLIQSDWARRYTIRAVAVIAMFDPDYDKDPTRAERQVRTQIRPLHVRHRKKLAVAVSPVRKPRGPMNRCIEDGPRSPYRAPVSIGHSIQVWTPCSALVWVFTVSSIRISYPYPNIESIFRFSKEASLVIPGQNRPRPQMVRPADSLVSSDEWK